MSAAGNPLMPSAGATPPTGPTQPTGSSMGPQPDEHDVARAKFDRVQQSVQRMAMVRQQMDKLLNLGDIVKPEDVIDAASELVGHGLTARTLAGMLSTMPAQKGEALKQWVQQRDQEARLREAALQKVLPVAQHQLALAAMKGLSRSPGMAPGGMLAQQSPQNSLMQSPQGGDGGGDEDGL